MYVHTLHICEYAFELYQQFLETILFLNRRVRQKWITRKGRFTRSTWDVLATVIIPTMIYVEAISVITAV